MSDNVVTSIRIPSDLYDKIKTDAEKNRRSINSQIVYSLQTLLQSPCASRHNQVRHDNHQTQFDDSPTTAPGGK